MSNNMTRVEMLNRDVAMLNLCMHIRLVALRVSGSLLRFAVGSWLLARLQL